MSNFEQYSDTEIIEKIIHGESRLYEILVKRNNAFLYKVGRSYNYNHDDTQDLMQESFVDAYRNLSEFGGRSSFRTWIIRIMLNHCYRKAQKHSFKNEVAKDIKEEFIPMFTNKHTDTNRMILNRELGHIIEQALQRLPEDYRMVFSLREITGLDVAETAEALDISEANVKTRLSRSKSMLRTEIERSYRVEDIFEFNLVYCDAMVNRVMQEIQQIK